MLTEVGRSSVMLVSNSEKAAQILTSILPQDRFSPVRVVTSAGEAKRTMIDSPSDIVIIDTPLKDDFGVQLAADLSQNEMTGIVLLVRAEQYDHVNYKTENYGILTISKPLDRRYMLQCLGFLAATRYKLLLMKNKTDSLQKKMEEISIVNRAKLLLIEKYKMSEADAHRYIEKSAMDHCVKRREIAESIIKNAQKVKG
ncbi:MAG: ANTAR domain-containing response regulator [Oscillospiraceae bacterium]